MSKPTDSVRKGDDRNAAWFSPCGRYRYLLMRTWNYWQQDTRSVAFLGLNPSTADENVDDPTIRRCIGYAKAWGYDRLAMLNLFALRATDPKEMLASDDPIGPSNNVFLGQYARWSDLVVCCWGNHGSHLGRADEVVEMLRDEASLTALRVTGAGQPSHPLYLPKTLRPAPFVA